MKTKGLGRGLSALIGENLDNSEDGQILHLETFKIIPNPNQPRSIFNKDSLDELTSSIAKNGVLQPILVREVEDKKYQIIAGERRWRATMSLGLAHIPAIVKDLSNNEVLEIALIENIQRENLTPIEEAESYKKLIDQHRYTQDKLAEIVSKSRSHIANLLRLLHLPNSVKKLLNDGLISVGHAKLLVNKNNAEELASIIAKNNLNVRETEDLIRQNNGFPPSNKGGSQYVEYKKNEDIKALED
ncbi:MAG: ParB/RepB/Spo0J family partition protein, partial [Pseudomonadota bacterium]